MVVDHLALCALCMWLMSNYDRGCGWHHFSLGCWVLARVWECGACNSFWVVSGFQSSNIHGRWLMRPRMPFFWWWLKSIWQPCFRSALSLHLLTREPRPWMWERDRQVMLSSCAFTWVRLVYKLQVQHHVWEAFLQVQIHLLRLWRPRADPKEGYNSLQTSPTCCKPFYFIFCVIVRSSSWHGGGDWLRFLNSVEGLICFCRSGWKVASFRISSWAPYWGREVLAVCILHITSLQDKFVPLNLCPRPPS